MRNKKNAITFSPEQRLEICKETSMSEQMFAVSIFHGELDQFKNRNYNYDNHSFVKTVFSNTNYE